MALFLHQGCCCKPTSCSWCRSEDGGEGVGESAAVGAEPAVDGSDGWAAANHRQIPLKKHDEGSRLGWNSIDVGYYRCCYCTDKSSTYCCIPTSPTHRLIKRGYTYNGTGSQTSSSSYTRR